MLVAFNSLHRALLNGMMTILNGRHLKCLLLAYPLPKYSLNSILVLSYVNRLRTIATIQMSFYAP